AGGSKAMHALAVGDTVCASAPKCDFPVTPDAPAVLLAGGIGITPMISMAASLAAAGTPVELHYAGRSRGVMAYADRLAETLGAALSLHCDDEADTALNLGALLGALGDRHLYICGPRGLIDAARAGAEAAGIPAGRVHVELFDNVSSGASAPAAQGDQPFEVEVASTGEVFTIPPGRSIIEVLEEGGMDLIYDCQRGDCGICQTEVLEGVPDHRDVVLSEAERAEGKLMQICVSRAKSPRLKLDL
ncbi:MAG: PDR/VanB family oxidoreductase, partial [Paracoccaceae bacterium]